MPGIVGLLTRMPREQAEPKLLRMVESLRHESFYVSGTWIDESLGVYVGWVQRKGSFADGMPLLNEKGDLALLFSGEEFPEPGTARALQQRGHACSEQGPSYLVHWCEEDPEFLAKLNGRFQGLLVDRARGTATLFNDRYGLHRVYFHEGKDAFYFAAEAKAILEVCPELRRIDARSMGEFVGCGCVLENRTLFPGIEALPPASAWIFRNAELAERNSYFKPEEWENQERLEPEAFYQELRASFTRVLPRYFEGRERVGVSLTGGLDTRMIMAWHKQAPGSLPCYTFRGPVRDSEDLILSRKVAAACGQPHQVIPIGSEFLAKFAEYAERTIYLTDGCALVNRSSDLYANERAREIAPVRMTGNYGSEVLRWAPAFKPGVPMAGLFSRDFEPHIAATRDTYAKILQGHPVSFAVFRQAPWHHYSLLALEQTQLSLRTPYLDNDFVRTAFRAPDPSFARPGNTNSDFSLRLIREGDPALGRIPTDRGLGGNGNRLLANASHQVLEFTFKAEYAYDYGMPQWLAKADHFLSPLHLEKLFLGRHKFAHYRVWYRDELGRYVQEMLLDARSLSRPYLNKGVVENLVTRHVKGEGNYTSAIHELLTLELMHRLFVDRQ